MLQRDSERWRRLTTAMLMSVSFGTYRRRRRDILMWCCGYVPLRRLGDLPMRRLWEFHLVLACDVVKTYQWDFVVNSSSDVVTTFQWDVVETYHWDVLATFYRDVVGWFIWDVTGPTERCRYDVATTFCCQVSQYLFKLPGF